MWRGNWRMEWATSTLHTTSEHGVSSITTADAHSSADASADLNGLVRFAKWRNLFLRVCHHISIGLYWCLIRHVCPSVHLCAFISLRKEGQTLKYLRFESLVTYPRANIKIWVTVLRINGHFTRSSLCTSAHTKNLTAFAEYSFDRNKFSYEHWIEK